MYMFGRLVTGAIVIAGMSVFVLGITAAEESTKAGLQSPLGIAATILMVLVVIKGSLEYGPKK